jgi:hypothetical protein
MANVKPALVGAVLLAICVTAASTTRGARLPAPSASVSPPVVMIVFDEFPTVSLLDRAGRIDRIRYPNFAALARASTWFPYATASVDETGRAMEALLTGNTPPERRRPATYAENPANVFTLLGGRYRVKASEEVTSMCPQSLCPEVREKDRRFVLHELAHGRAERFARWVAGLHPRRRPTFYFKHVLLPHVPLRYLPSGQRYSSRAHEVVPGVTRAFHNRWLVEQIYQRHLLQLGFTDRLLGVALDRLRKTGLWHRALLVVTADNGESFGHFGDRHVITRRKAADVALTPLFVKLPGQRRGRVVRRLVRTVDVLPTIARVVHLHLPWATEGRSLFGPSAGRPRRSVLLHERSGGRLRVALPALRRQARGDLGRKLALFGAGAESPGVYGIGPAPLVLGTPLALWPRRPAGQIRAVLNGAPRLRSVAPRSSFVPAYVTGRIVGAPRSGHRNLAVAVNGWIAATAPSYHLGRGAAEFFSAVVPEGAFQAGSNRVEILAISSGGGPIRLRSLGGIGQ